MKTLYLECNMGAAGDMLTAALTELMPDPDAFVQQLNDLQIPQVKIKRTTIAKCGIMGTHMEVTVNGEEEKSVDVPLHITMRSMTMCMNITTRGMTMYMSTHMDTVIIIRV